MLFGGSKKNVGFWKPTGHSINAGCRQMLSCSLLLSTKCCGFACQTWRLWDWKPASLLWYSKLSVTSAKFSVSKAKSPLATKLEHFIRWLCFDVKSLLTKLFSSRRNLIELTQDQKTDLLVSSIQCMSIVLSLCDNWCKQCQKCVPWAAEVLDTQSPVDGFVGILVLLERDSVLLILCHWLRAWVYQSPTPAFTIGNFTGVNWFITYFH